MYGTAMVLEFFMYIAQFLRSSIKSYLCKYKNYITTSYSEGFYANKICVYGFFFKDRNQPYILPIYI